MRYLHTLFLITILCTCLPVSGYCQGQSPGQSVSAQRMLPVSEAGTMAEGIYQTIKDKHPFAFRTQGVAALDAARTQVLSDLAEAMTKQDSVPYHEFVRLVSPLQQATQCGHLILEPYQDSLIDVSLRENHFDLQMMPVDSGQQYVLIRGIRTTKDSLPPGTLIRTVNKTSTATLIDQLSNFNGVNDQGNDYASKTLAARAFSLQYQRYYGLQDSLTLEIDRGQGTAEQRVLPPKHRPWKIPKKTVGDINKTLQFELSDDGLTGILTIRTFSTLKFNNGNYYKYIRGVMDSLNVGNVPNLIIDLRSNTGGNSQRINYLFSYLSEGKFQFCQRAELTGPAKAVAGESEKDRKRRENGAVSRRQRRLQKMLTRQIKPRKEKYRYTGKVAVLIDEITFSASGMFARFVQGSGRGILVGTTAGASANITYGASTEDNKNYYGPRDDFRLRVNGIMLELPYPIPGNVTPDIPVAPTLDGVREGKDEVLETAIDALTGRKR